MKGLFDGQQDQLKQLKIATGLRFSDNDARRVKLGGVKVVGKVDLSKLRG